VRCLLTLAGAVALTVICPGISHAPGLIMCGEHWTPSEGQVFRGSSGTIQGDLGIWRYAWDIENPCDSWIEIREGALVVHECHRKACDPSGKRCRGSGRCRVWLDRFDQGQERLPLGQIKWACKPSLTDLGAGGSSKCCLGLKDGGLRDDNPSTLRLKNDFLCLRGLKDGGSLYFGATLSNHSLAADTNTGEMSILGISLLPRDIPSSCPPDEAQTVVEAWRGIRGTYRPRMAHDPHTGTGSGEVRVPGDLGTWVFFFQGTRGRTDSCDPRVEIADGAATIHECHTRTCDAGSCSSAGGWRFYLAESSPYLALTPVPVYEPPGRLYQCSIEALSWDAAVSGQLGTAGRTTSAVSLEKLGLREAGAIGPPGPRILTFSPPARANDLGDAFSPFLLRFGLYSNANHNRNESTTAIRNVRLAILPATRVQ